MRLSRKEREARRREKEMEAARRAAIEQQAAIQRAIGESGLHQFNTGKAELYEGKAKDGRVGKMVYRRAHTNTLWRYHYTEHYITFGQYKAGEKIYSLWAASQPPGSVRMEHIRRDSFDGLPDNALDALTAYHAARMAIVDMLARSYVYSVCIEGKPLDMLRGIDTKKKPQVLRNGLETLREHFGY